MRAPSSSAPRRSARAVDPTRSKKPTVRSDVTDAPDVTTRRTAVSQAWKKRLFRMAGTPTSSRPVAASVASATASSPACRASSAGATFCPKFVMAASAIWARAEAVTRVNCSVGSSPNISTADRASSKTSTSLATNCSPSRCSTKPAARATSSATSMVSPLRSATSSNDNRGRRSRSSFTSAGRSPILRARSSSVAPRPVRYLRTASRSSDPVASSSYHPRRAQRCASSSTSRRR